MFNRIVLLFSLFWIVSAYSDIPLATDSRIRTYIYNPNDVYLVIINTGFQTSIEFEPGEKIQTMSLGDMYSWSLNPVQNRLFIKPLEDNVRTNMTILTNMRSYQFDVVSSSSKQNLKDIAYVIRFYYPKTN
jgi:type IV secretion system protein VirB9